MNLAFVGPRADSFSLGVVLAQLVGLEIANAGAQDRQQQVRVLCRFLGRPSLDELPPDWRAHFRGVPQTVPFLDFSVVRVRFGAGAQDLLQQLLAWQPASRPSSSEVSNHVFPRGGRLLGLGPLGQPQKYQGRHAWTIRTACLDHDVLLWLQEEVSMDIVSGDPDSFGKYAIAGCTDMICEGSLCLAGAASRTWCLCRGLAHGLQPSETQIST